MGVRMVRHTTYEDVDEVEDWQLRVFSDDMMVNSPLLHGYKDDEEEKG
jgi:hypothetical protein